MPDLQTQQLMKQPPNNSIQKQMQDRSFLWCIQLISFHNACIIHGAMPLYMILCHSSEAVKSWKLSTTQRRLVTRLSASHEIRSPTAQLAQRLTEKPGAIMTRVRVPGGARNFSPSQLSMQTLLRYSHSHRVICLQVSFQCRLSYVFAQPRVICLSHKDVAELMMFSSYLYFVLE